MALPLIFVVNAIAGTAIRFAAKKAAQSFVKKYGGKIVSNAGKRKVLSNTASGVKRFMDKFKSTKGGQKNLTKKLKKDDMIALTSKIKKPGSGQLSIKGGRSGQINKSGSGSSVKKPGTSVGNTKSGQTNKIDWSKLRNITPKPKPKSNVKPPVNRPPSKVRVGNLIKTGNILLQSELAEKVPAKIGNVFAPPPPAKGDKGEIPIAVKKRTIKKKKKDVPIDVKKRTLKKKPSPIQSRKTRKGPIKKPDTSQLTGKFGVNGFSRTGSTMSDFLIGFTDGKGGKGRNYDKFMAKDKNNQYKVKSDTLKSMAKRLKEKMKKG